MTEHGVTGEPTAPGTPNGGLGWDRADTSWAFPGFTRAELEGIVDFLHTGKPLNSFPKKAYLSGPMSGYPLHNFPAFHEASAILRGMFGVDLLSPHEIEHSGSDLTREEYLRKDLQQMLSLECGNIIMMGDWLKSWGACFELNVAAKLGWGIYLYRSHQAKPYLLDGERLRYYVR